jgi:uncharacterized DUF497 family protein/uncharacterized protein (DUF4415 family)
VNVEWDEHKRRRNIAKHGLDFVDAERVVHSPLLVDIDDRMDYGEDRWLAYGLLDSRVVVLLYTEPNRAARRFESFPCGRPRAWSVITMTVRSETDWARVDALADEEIDTSDIPEQTEEFFRRAALRLPKDVETVTVRLDADTLDWYRSHDDAEQRMSAALRLYADAHRA